MSYKQIIVVRKDLNMSYGKMAAQVSHASMAFLISLIKTNIKDYKVEFDINKNLYEQWINNEFTKVILQAKNKNHLLKAATLANEIGLKENEDYFLIKDNCHTELTPEEDGKCLTCIGFKPMDKEIIDKISKKYQLYK